MKQIYGYILIQTQAVHLFGRLFLFYLINDSINYILF